ncbi:uncharacterized protein BDW70DRAFT_152406 [Aspergillus foveolatus]|uniref:uncharacterized protein n=1 Tax=Aspergillus foveolatus TaxID=210207 RepID=UPI003CCD7242
MPSIYKKSSPSLVGSAPDQVRAPTTESKLSLRSLFSRKARAPAVTEPLAVKAHSRQATAPAPVPGPDQEQKEPDSIPSALHPTSTLPSPSSLRPEPESEPEPPKESQTQAQTTWEDIDPPTTLLSLAADHSISSASIASRYQQSTQTEPTAPVPTSNPTTTMLISSSRSPSTPSLLPSYSDVSGAVVVDAYGTPRFLTPQEEQERKEALAQAVRERMMGLPRRTDFSWEASATPVLPRWMYNN